ncbi:uncharacterized protein LOC111704239 isoform X2 [Eurytemora carolleeae]|nr:uncharacterized protein LOC111704239 isoform X2 [Eurytemora carolleeae]XP_023332167.1 uncharacterized protein LOC111704239 isoform X2 [Eurytemora carolleeae]XP_023332168.1 uncharacterized protein LOC111704239 isoform X2 [Eurytemora carolleeae]|eukprot:XP_023332166.1 uncharacterized protein LOC111704239 isoform X2 [Eurytemora affinis]
MINECKESSNRNNSCIYHCPPISKDNYLAFPNNLHRVNHYLFKGKQTFQKDFRVLIAGGGTGMNTLYIAEQLNHTNSEIVYVDLSPKSTDIARLRAKYRHLNNIRFFNDKIENIPNLNLGKFDFIESTGVIHHTENPLTSLRVLKDSLKPEGGMSIFVYSTNKRKYVYLMQEVMRLMRDDSDSIFDEIANLKELGEVLPHLPLGKLMEGPSLSVDMEDNDENLYDIFLHKRDTSFTVPQLFQWVKDAGLIFIDWSNPLSAWLIKEISDPFKENGWAADWLVEQLQNDGQAGFREIINKLSREDKLAMADLMFHFKLTNHQFYLSNSQDSKASLDDLDLMPYFPFEIKHLDKVVNGWLKGVEKPKMVKMVHILGPLFGHSFSLPDKMSLQTFYKLIPLKPEKTLREVFRELKTKTGKSINKLREEFQNFAAHFEHFLVLGNKDMGNMPRSNINYVYDIEY